MLFGYLSVAVVLGVVIDHTRTAVSRSGSQEVGPSERGASGEPRRTGPRSAGLAALAALVVAAAAIVPPVVYLAPRLPLTIEPVVLPDWYQSVAPHLPGHPVVLSLPAPFDVTSSHLTWYDSQGNHYALSISGKQAAMTWQALSGQRYSQVGAGGLGTGVRRTKVETQGQAVITEVTFAYATPPDVTTADIAAVHRSLVGWRTTTVVLARPARAPRLRPGRVGRRHGRADRGRHGHPAGPRRRRLGVERGRSQLPRRVSRRSAVLALHERLGEPRCGGRSARRFVHPCAGLLVAAIRRRFRLAGLPPRLGPLSRRLRRRRGLRGGCGARSAGALPR